MRAVACVMIGWLAGAVLAPAAAVTPFRVGERLHYRMFWGPVIIGHATLEVRGIEPVDGHDCYHLVAEARTVGIGRMFFKLDSATESWLDVEGLFSRRFQQNRQEGRRHKRAVTDFDYARGETITRNLLSGREKRSPLAQPVQDIISALYYVRSQPLALHQPAQFTVNAGDKNWTVTFRPDKRQKFEFRAVGEVDALRIEPTPTIQFVAENKGRLWFWVSDDRRKLPLQVKSTMTLGTATLMLHHVDHVAPAKLSRASTAVVAAR